MTPASCTLATARPALAGDLTKTITLPDGRTRQVTVLASESKARGYEGRGFNRSSLLESRAKTVRCRDEICKFAVNPLAQSQSSVCANVQRRQWCRG